MVDTPAYLVGATAVWTAVWVAAPRRLSERAELAAGLIPFALFGLRVFAGFFVDVPDEDPVARALAPLLDVVRGGAYQVAIDAAAAVGIAWVVSVLDLPRRTRLVTAWLLPAICVVGLAVGDPAELWRGRLGPWAGVLAAVVLATFALVTPSDVDRKSRRLIAMWGGGTIALLNLALHGIRVGFEWLLPLPWPNWLWPGSTLVVSAVCGAALAWAVPLRTTRGRLVLGGATAVIGGSLASG